MARRKLTNYLRTHRKRAHFSQEEVVFLLDCNSIACVSRHEHFVRAPTLETAFAYEIIFGVPVRELFAGTFESVEWRVNRRMRRLIERLCANDATQLRERDRLALVLALLESRLNPPQNEDTSGTNT